MSTSIFVFAGTLILALHEPVRVPGSGSDPLWISDSRVLEGQLAGQGYVLSPKAEGLAHLSQDPRRIERLLVTSSANLEALKKCPKAALRVGASGLEPQSDSPAELRKLQLCGFDKLAIPEPRSAELENRLKAAESRALSEIGVPARTASLEKGRRVLELPASAAPAIRAKLGELAPFFEIRATSASHAKPGRTLVFEVTLFEFSRRRAEALGLRLPQRLVLKGETGLHAWRPEGFDLGADFGESLGVSKVLARPQIRAKPGEKASFQSGGEIPVRTSTLYGQQTHWKSYGLTLFLEPEASVSAGAPEVALGFRLELAEPDLAGDPTDGTLGFLTRRLESRFDLRVGETTVLTTMIQSRSGTRRSGPYGSTSGSFLRRLFAQGSESFEDSELLISIRPEWERGGRL